MELINRYVYAVLRHIPAPQRADIEKEIRTMIDELLHERLKNRSDMAAETADAAHKEPDEADIKAVLTELGEPAQLARQYLGYPRYVIGPALYDTYWLVVRVVLLAVGIGLLVAQSIQLVSSSQTNAWTALGGFTGGLYQGLLSAFATVTLIFVLIERFARESVTAEIKQEKAKWRLDDLPQVPSEKLRIKRGDPIVAVIFSLIFLAIINISPELFGFYQQTEDGLQITAFLGEGFFALLGWINLVIVFGLVLETCKIIYARWTWPILLGSMVQNVLSLVVGLRVVRHPAFISPDFIEIVNTFFAENDASVTVVWQQPLVTGLTVIIAFGFTVEMITLIAKAFRLLQAGKNEV